ncbi:hypothetical protein DDB_G0288745 [Dictyostelium discoideum AX4]|uniref:Transmembrane protein n=1 Tax=Dictyostelium discoideum TaxID=44689 RepID=Q1ZXD1_DICDI|nr:hypothetical protein DDB_G0288745 [Dictyostelium discoideum AX4]EAS66837.1 hypothetical protein DDB_G0288745 [Dictyostelium discoideum AX4]|eukprot:XP_001134520.1 hypothetical protein DDB_G0288745 [Dictyostelium discoideum AX4]
MHVLNLLFLIVIINILIFSVQSYTLKKYDYGQFLVIASGPVINKKFNVANHQVSNFLLTKDENDSNSVQLRITSDGAPEFLIFYSTFSDEIASEKNSNKTNITTPLEGSMCISSVYSFSIKMNNYLLGGDYIISILGNSDVSKCYKHVPVNQANQEPESIVLLSTSSEQLVLQSDGETVVQKNIENQKSTASTPLVNGVLIFSTVLLFLQLII